jgi:hypothetical protein
MKSDIAILSSTELSGLDTYPASRPRYLDCNAVREASGHVSGGGEYRLQSKLTFDSCRDISIRGALQRCTALIITYRIADHRV